MTALPSSSSETAGPGATADNSDIIVMLARQRSGTNPLRSVLDKHPDICCIPEIFNTNPTADYDLEVATNYFRFVERHYRGRSVAEVLSMDDASELFSAYLEYLRCFSDKRYVLVDVKYNSTHHVRHAWRFISEEPLLFTLLKDNGVRVLHLTRSNYLRYYVSEQKAQATNRWHAFDAEVVGHEAWFVRRHKDQSSRPGDLRIRLDVDDLMRTLRLCRLENQAVTDSFRDYDRVLSLEYQDVFPTSGGPMAETALSAVADWLGVPAELPERRPSHKKQSDLPLDQTVENWDEVVQALGSTEFAGLLEDEPMYATAPEARP